MVVVLVTLIGCYDFESYRNYPEPSIPQIRIEVEGERSITSKKDYETATVFIDYKGEYANFTGEASVRGRGNDSWRQPKKPYRIKLDDAASLFGLPAYKNWILLAEYRDGSMLYNSIPYYLADKLGLPYTNSIIPVELFINDEYQGMYVFSEHKEVGEGRIDIDKDEGLLLELDAYYDEEWQFKSDNYDLPVMIQFPKEKDMSEEKFNQIKADFNAFEALVFDDSFPNNNYLEFFDDESFVNYMIVYELTRNIEINHPKSTYINKVDADGKYRMGIVWDFDWAFGFNPTKRSHYNLSQANYPLLKDSNYLRPKPGTLFFERIMSDPHIQNLFKDTWEGFRENGYDDLIEYVKDYGASIGKAVVRDHSVWGRRGANKDPKVNLEKTLKWLDTRAAYLDQYVESF